MLADRGVTASSAGPVSSRSTTARREARRRAPARDVCPSAPRAPARSAGEPRGWKRRAPGRGHRVRCSMRRTSGQGATGGERCPASRGRGAHRPAVQQRAHRRRQRLDDLTENLPVRQNGTSAPTISGSAGGARSDLPHAREIAERRLAIAATTGSSGRVVPSPAASSSARRIEARRDPPCLRQS